VLVLVILTGATLLALASMDSGVMEMRMAGTVEASTRNFQLGHAVIDFTLSDSANLPSTGPLRQPKTVDLSDPIFAVTTGDTITATASRIEDCGLPPRSKSASSLNAYSAFNYEVDATIEHTTSGQGRAEMSQGYLLLGPRC